jgi:hypothetical protein
MYDCTPYQMQAVCRRVSHNSAVFGVVEGLPMAARLKTGHRDPHIPNEDLLMTGKPMWYVAPMRPVMQIKQPAME